MSETRIFDARGMKCPLPVLKARKLMKELAPGDILEVQATDPGAPGDFRHFCETTGHRLRESGEADGVFIIRLECVRS
ncbi:MAG: sulfurtransferase TusA family protein [Rhodospirillaceae bacterium]|jgi:tRNA 2-thiouridine synthesizing protein A|nr:sulfurtransferase TusA family protein [Rhodospirillaceae bacterium]